MPMVHLVGGQSAGLSHDIQSVRHGQTFDVVPPIPMTSVSADVNDAIHETLIIDTYRAWSTSTDYRTIWYGAPHDWGWIMIQESLWHVYEKCHEIIREA